MATAFSQAALAEAKRAMDKAQVAKDAAAQKLTKAYGDLDAARDLAAEAFRASDQFGNREWSAAYSQVIRAEQSGDKAALVLAKDALAKATKTRDDLKRDTADAYADAEKINRLCESLASERDSANKQLVKAMADYYSMLALSRQQG